MFQVSFKGFLVGNYGFLFFNLARQFHPNLHRRRLLCKHSGDRVVIKPAEPVESQREIRLTVFIQICEYTPALGGILI